jgi:acyl-coenzyme A thioesterase PaaI-like protein
VVFKQPNSRMCFACGLENPFGLHLHFYDNGHDEVLSDFTINPNHQGYPGIAQGGIVAAILDEVGGRTMMIGDPMRLFMTAKMEIKYRQPVPVGVPLRAVGRLIKLKARLATARAEIRSGDQVLAEAELVLSRVPVEVFNLSDADKIGWKVYQEGR